MSKFARSLLVTVLILTATTLSACGGALAAQAASDNSHDASSTEVLSTESAQSSDAPQNETETPEVESTETPEAQSTESPDANEVSGVVTAMDATTITVDGVVYNLADFTEIKGTIQVGDNVKLELAPGPDGTLVVREISPGGSHGSEDANSGSQGGSGHDSGGSSGDDGDSHDGGPKP